MKWDSVNGTQNDSLELYSIFFPTISTGYISAQIYLGNSVYKNFLLKTTNGGTKWDSIPNALNYIFGTLFFVNENTGFTGSGGRLLKTTNGGLNWAQINYSASGWTDMKFLNHNTGYCTSYNVFTKTTNGGLNWINYYGPGPSKFDIVNEKAIGAAYNQIYNSTNGGINWINHSSSFTDYDFWDIKFADKDNGYLIPKNNKVLKTSNGGANWSEFTLGDEILCSVAPVNSQICYIANGFEGRIYKTTNGSATWNTLSLSASTIYEIKFLNENTGFGICKYGKFFKTTNGGLNWFYKQGLVNTESGAIHFLNENTGMVAGTHAYKTTDGGVNWTEINLGMYTYDIKFINKDTIFAVGHTNVSGDRISYVLRTVDGGITWERTILNVSGPRYIQFPNERTGYIQGDDAQYKTTNSGANWFPINAGLQWGLTGFDWLDSLNGYSVGLNGAILKTTNGGETPGQLTPFPYPKTYSLYQNYPNPFNSSTKIKFDLPIHTNQTDIPVKVIIFDILGRKLETLLDENLTAGVHEINWNASRYAAGVYFYMLLTDGIKESKKMILIK